MNGSAPKSLLTGFHADRKKKLSPNLCSVSVECPTSSAAISPTMPKMLSAHSTITQRNVPSAQPELPRPCRNTRTADGSVDEGGTATGPGPPAGAAGPGVFGARGSWILKVTPSKPYRGIVKAML